MAPPNFPDADPVPAPEPTIPLVKEPDDVKMPRSPVLEPEDPDKSDEI